MEGGGSLSFFTPKTLLIFCPLEGFLLLIWAANKPAGDASREAQYSSESPPIGRSKLRRMPGIWIDRKDYLAGKEAEGLEDGGDGLLYW